MAGQLIKTFPQVRKFVRRERFPIPLNLSGLHIQSTDEDRSRIDGYGFPKNSYDFGSLPGMHIRVDENDLLRAYVFSQSYDVASRQGLFQARVSRHLIHFIGVDQDDPSFHKPGREALNGFRTSPPSNCFCRGVGDFDVGTVGLCNGMRIVALAAGQRHE